MTTPRDAFLAAVCDRPDDDAPRLIYADWLEENGEGEYGAFIRVQCELARTDCPGCRLDYPCREGGLCRKARLYTRERELAWRERNDLRTWSGLEQPWTVTLASFPIPSDVPLAIFSRGFIEEVRLELATLIGPPCPQCHASGWVAAGLSAGAAAEETCERCRGSGRVALDLSRWPVREVRVTDREPARDDPPFDKPNWSWYSEGVQTDRATLPHALFDLLTGWESSITGGSMRRVYPSPSTAHAALSAAALRLATGG